MPRAITKGKPFLPRSSVPRIRIFLSKLLSTAPSFAKISVITTRISAVSSCTTTCVENFPTEFTLPSITIGLPIKLPVSRCSSLAVTCCGFRKIVPPNLPNKQASMFARWLDVHARQKLATNVVNTIDFKGTSGMGQIYHRTPRPDIMWGSLLERLRIVNWSET